MTTINLSSNGNEIKYNNISGYRSIFIIKPYQNIKLKSLKYLIEGISSHAFVFLTVSITKKNSNDELFYDTFYEDIIKFDKDIILEENEIYELTTKIGLNSIQISPPYVFFNKGSYSNEILTDVNNTCKIEITSGLYMKENNTNLFQDDKTLNVKIDIESLGKNKNIKFNINKGLRKYHEGWIKSNEKSGKIDRIWLKINNKLKEI